MDEYQLGIFGDVRAVRKKDRTSPTPPKGFTPEPKNTTLEAIRARPASKKTGVRCEKHTGEFVRMEWFVHTYFSDKTSFAMALCSDCKERYLKTFAPYSNTGQIKGNDGGSR